MWAFSPIFVVMAILGGFGPAMADVEDIYVSIYSRANRTGRRERVFVGNCLPINDETRSRVPKIESLQPRGLFLRAYEFDCCQGRTAPIYPARNTSLDLTKAVEDPSARTYFVPRSIGRMNMLELVAPDDDIEDPLITKEERDNDEHSHVLRFTDVNSAVYFSSEQNYGSADWLYNFMSLGWGQVKNVYGPLGREGKIYGIFHGHAHGHQAVTPWGTFLQNSSQCLNIMSVVPPSDAPHHSRNVFIPESKEVLDKMAAQMSAIVEQSFGGIQNSASANLTRNSAFADIFTYDLYMNLSMTADADRVKTVAEKRQSDTPRAGTKWWSNWFYPLYNQYKGSKFLTDFFRLQSTYFPTTVTEQGPKCAREMNLGEYVHFCSGAARAFLGAQAYQAFGFNLDFKKEAQYMKARDDFPEVTKLYGQPVSDVTTPKAPVDVTTRKTPVAVTTPKVPLFK